MKRRAYLNCIGAVIIAISIMMSTLPVQIFAAEAVVMLARLLGRSEVFTPGKAFTDVTTSHWAYNAIMNAVNGRL